MAEQRPFFNYSKNDEMPVLEDDPEFDMLNDETFGHGLSDDDDWEAQHEHLAHEYNKENGKGPRGSIHPNSEAKEEEVDTNGISEQMIQFVLSDNEGQREANPREDGFRIIDPVHNLENKSAAENGRWFSWIPPQPPLAPMQQLPPALPKIPTLEEIERDLIKSCTNKNENVTTPGSQPSQPSNTVLPLNMDNQFNFSRLPPPPHNVPPPAFIQTPLNMMNIVQQMPPPPVHLQGPPPPFPYPPGAFMPHTPQTQSKRFPSDFPRMDGRGGIRHQGHDFQNRRGNVRGGRGGHHGQYYEPFNMRGGGQRMYRPSNSNLQQHSQNVVEDEYANLMTVQEKNWLAQIQQYQLNSMNPTKEDYYYTTFMSRKQGSSIRKNNNFGGSQRSVREIPPKTAYTPLQFENSLGKLQVGSVIAPRKIIDIDVVENVDPFSQAAAPTPKQIFMEIELMFNYVLEMEECDAADQPCYLLPHGSDKLVEHISERSRFYPYMNIHKGRQVVLRLLPYVNNTCPIMKKMVGSMVPISRKVNGDGQLLLSYLPFIRAWLAEMDMQQLVCFAVQAQPAIHHILTNKFTISVLANMVERAELLLQETPDAEDVKWNSFIRNVVKQTLELDGALERPVVGIDPHVLKCHLIRCTGDRFTPEQLTVALKTLSNASPSKPTDS
ncbi:protein PAT1 homolog 1 [Nilaparvata lugens]|uniref:protein PAT1 homolog 1 n=1 Tax=Nilaparvata lugens TaxID=108931 RepID=UPI00193E30D3|nr:protein PAT1 homolog 1 [Nilaparvata lugens]